MKKTVAIRNKQTKPVELIFFENLCRDNMVLRMSLKYIHESTSLTEAGYHVRLVNNLFRSFPQIYGGNFEVVFKIEKETESGPPIYKVVLLCEGKCITELFELDIREIHETEVQRRLKIPKPLNDPEVNEFMELLERVSVIKDALVQAVMNSSSLNETLHGIWLVNHTIKSLVESKSLSQQYAGYEIWFTAKKDEERGPVSFKVFLLYKGRVITVLFENVEVH